MGTQENIQVSTIREIMKIVKITQSSKERGNVKQPWPRGSFESHKTFATEADYLSSGGKPRYEQPIHKVVWHGTYRTDELIVPDNKLGTHFGSQEAAQDRVAMDPLARPSTLRAYNINIERPLRMNDIGWASATSIQQELYRLGIVEQKPQPINRGTMTFLELREAILNAGYDGIVYENHNEGKADSYIALKQDQFSEIPNAEAIKEAGLSPSDIKFSNPMESKQVKSLWGFKKIH